MEYVIKNNKNLYIRLSENGRPVTCNKEKSGLFEYQKALNILNGLPRPLKKLKFRIEALDGTVPARVKGSTILNENYKLPDNITAWIGKFGLCGDILKDADERAGKLSSELSVLDKELTDLLHRIEFETPKDLYRGWLVYKKIKQNREKRRLVKDELLIVSQASRLKTNSLDRQDIQKMADGLLKRKYRVRVTDEDKGND